MLPYPIDRHNHYDSKLKPHEREKNTTTKKVYKQLYT